MDIIYKIMFIVGILYTFVSVIINGVSGALHIGHHIGHIDGHLGGHSHVGGHSHGHVLGHSVGHTGDINSHSTHSGHDSGIQHSFLSWFSILINPLVAVSFLTIFGGIGILGTEYFKWVAILVFFVSLASAVSVSFLLYRYIAIPLYKSENSTDVSREDLVNTPAEVISPILKGGFGKIKYVVNDIRYTAPAKHIEGESVEQGKKVVICKLDSNVFYVSEIEEI
ncbi:MAG: serine protease [Bacillota bacterium]|nr:serine protease [Bacillota bacterium]